MHPRTKAAEKGLFMLRSYSDPPETPKERQQWVSHTGRKQKIRYLRNICKDILRSKDVAVIESLERVREIVQGQFEEYGLLMVIHQAKDVSDSTGVPFVEAMDYITDKLKADKEDSIVETKIENPCS